MLSPQDFASVDLDLTTIQRGRIFGRIYRDGHKNPLGFGKSGSRFSDPRQLPEKDRFGVVYLGSTLKVCFLEAVLRDDRDGVVGDYPIEENELRTRRYALIEVVATLHLVNLRANGPIRMGIPSDAVRASDQRLSRQLSSAIHEHPAGPDGIIYPSRLNNEVNVAIYEHALKKLRARPAPVLLMSAPGLATVLDELKVAISP